MCDIMEILNGVIGVGYGTVLYQIIKPDYLSMLTITENTLPSISARIRR